MYLEKRMLYRVIPNYRVLYRAIPSCTHFGIYQDILFVKKYIPRYIPFGQSYPELYTSMVYTEMFSVYTGIYQDKPEAYIWNREQCYRIRVFSTYQQCSGTYRYVPSTDRYRKGIIVQTGTYQYVLSTYQNNVMCVGHQ